MPISLSMSSAVLTSTAILIGFLQSAVYLSCVAFINFAPLLISQPWDSIDIAFRIVKVTARLRIDAFDGPNHFRCEQNVVDGDDLSKQFYSWKMIYARVEVHILQEKFSKRGSLQVLSDTSEATPVIRNRAAAMWNYQS